MTKYIIEIETSYNSGTFEPLTLSPTEYDTRQQALDVMRAQIAEGANVDGVDDTGLRLVRGMRVAEVAR